MVYSLFVKQYALIDGAVGRYLTGLAGRIPGGPRLGPRRLAGRPIIVGGSPAIVAEAPQM